MRRILANHLPPLLAYLLLGLVVTWPLAVRFDAGIIAQGEDGLHNLWLIWHTREALRGAEPLLGAPRLYYPEGISLLTHGLGPVLGLLALPFWPWGPAAAYNGAALLGYTLSGYGLYLLARELGLGRPAALVGGACLMLAPMVSAGFLGHMTKLFVGGMPLALLATRRALSPQRHPLWLAAPGLALLLVALHSGYQLVLAGLACAGLGAWWAQTGEVSKTSPAYPAPRRALWAALLAAAILAPLLVATLRAGADPRMQIDLRDLSRQFQPDLLLFLLPSPDGRLLGDLARGVVGKLDITYNIETTVALGVTAGLLALVGAVGRPAARPFVVLTLACVALSLGPSLLIAKGSLGILMPYTLFSALPGISFFRVPARFMLLGFVGLAVAAAFGVEVLARAVEARVAGGGWRSGEPPRHPPPATTYHAGVVTAAALALLVAEGLPQPFPRTTLPAPPAFYRQIAGDPELYGVFDLPIHSDLNDMRSYVMFSAHYQLFQMAHGKGIAAGYLSRTYAAHPRFPALFGARPPRENAAPPLTVNGRHPALANAQNELAAAGYRYLVWHKRLLPGHPAQVDAARLIAAAFGAQPPLAEDADAAVYAVTATVSTTARLDDGWYAFEEGYRWAGPGATLAVESARAQAARLTITPAAIFDPTAPGSLGPAGTIRVQVGDGPPVEAPIAVDRPTSIPLRLPAGPAIIRLSLVAGSFRPSELGGPDTRELSFAVRLLDLEAEHEP